jgi:hypothetical protein
MKEVRFLATPQIRVIKLERFIGSILSIAKVFFERPDDEAVTECDLYLPTIK